MSPRTTPRIAKVALAAAVLAPVLAACAPGTSTDDSGSGGDAGTAPKTVTLVTHDSWAMPDKLKRQFEQQSGYTLKVLQSGDAGQLTNKLVLTKDNPLGDVVFGIDNTFASRAVDAGVLAPYTPAGLPQSASAFALPDEQGSKDLTPVDWGDVCVNVDDTWFADHDLAEPKTLDDLTDPTYKDLFVTSGAATSSPGFAFLLATIGTYGENGWEDYWRKLMDNGTRVVSGWTDAYEVDFTAGGGDGDRPIVLSYNSSPPYTIPKGGKRPTTSALLDTCFRQVEYAGVLAGAENPEGAQAFVDFMTSRPFQESLPENMYVFPVDADAHIPASWARWAPPAKNPIEVDPADISAHRDEWLRTWSDVTAG